MNEPCEHQHKLPLIFHRRIWIKICLNCGATLVEDPA